MEKLDKVLEIAKKMNELSDYDVPFLEGYELQKNTAQNVIFCAVNKDHSVYQLVTDGILKENETFDAKLESVIMETIDAMKNLGVYNLSNGFVYLSSINRVFKFKIYAQNYKKNVNGENRIVNQINVYFVDNNNKFYQLSLSSAPYIENTIDSEEVITKLYTAVINIVNGIKFFA